MGLELKKTTDVANLLCRLIRACYVGTILIHETLNCVHFIPFSNRALLNPLEIGYYDNVDIVMFSLPTNKTISRIKKCPIISSNAV